MAPNDPEQYWFLLLATISWVAKVSWLLFCNFVIVNSPQKLFVFTTVLTVFIGGSQIFVYEL